MTMSMPHTAIPPPYTLADARRRLIAPRRRKPAPLKMLAAAAILALSTLLLAGSVILGPFWQTKDAQPCCQARITAKIAGRGAEIAAWPQLRLRTDFRLRR